MQSNRPRRLHLHRVTAIIVGMMLATGLVVSAPVGASADEDIRGNSTGGGFFPGERIHYTAAEKAAITAKHELWNAYSDYLAGSMNRDQYTAAEARAERRLGVQLRGPVEAAKQRPPCDPNCPSSKVVLSVRHASQGTTFTCGSTTGYMIARYEGRRHSRFNHARLTGKNMGGRKHMRTYIKRATPWNSKNFRFSSPFRG